MAGYCDSAHLEENEFVVHAYNGLHGSLLFAWHGRYKRRTQTAYIDCPRGVELGFLKEGPS